LMKSCSSHEILCTCEFSILQLRLQQRRTREQLADQGIIRRACRHTHKPHTHTDLHTNSHASMLLDFSVNQTDSSSLDDQMRLKRAQLAEDLNEKLALRPGPLELVQKNIIPLDSALTMTVNHGKFPKQEDSYAFEEDSSSESLSPEQHHSDESPGSACPSSEAVGSTASSSSSPALTSPRQVRTHLYRPLKSFRMCSFSPVAPSSIYLPLVSSCGDRTSDKNRHKKPKDVKPKVKKLKYHQYIPPDQKAEKSPPPMDSAYARLLQQQQLFLQLQILSQQKHAHTQSHEQLSVCTSNGPSSQTNCSSSSPVKNSYPNQSTISPVKPGPLPANLDDLKVSELRQHLRIRGMPVSGTKTALIERLRPFKDSNAGSSPSGSSDITTVTFPVTPTGSLSSYQSPSSSSALSHGGYYPYPSTSSTPPISPASSELSLSGSLPDSFSDVPMSSPTQFNLQPSPRPSQHGGRPWGIGMEAEKDKMLVEKQKVIEELTWKLHQEQRQVRKSGTDLLKGRLSTGKLLQQHDLSPPSLVWGGPSGPQCMDTTPSTGSPSTMSAFLSPQCSPQDSPIGKPSGSPQPSSPNNPYMLTPSLGRDGCRHPHPQGNNRVRNMQVTCVLLFNSRSTINSFTVLILLQQLTRSQQMDELLDVLIESGEMPANAREERERSSVTKVVPHINVSPGCPGLLIPRFHRHYEHLSPSQLPYDHAANHIAESHLETLLGSPIARGAEGALLKMAAEDGGQEDEGNRDSEGYGSPHNHHRHPHHPQQDKLMTNRELMDTPLSPISINTKVSCVPEVQGMVSMTFNETPWETMEWLDLTPPSSATAFSVAPPTGPSIFNTEFLDVTDINLNSAMDLHLEHW
uniref:Myocardin n=1 Tax=Labrus bergylta TaxID=56723 RepID=A0A3Q3H1I5_9LABR